VINTLDNIFSYVLLLAEHRCLFCTFVWYAMKESSSQIQCDCLCLLQVVRIGLLHFQAGGRKMLPDLPLVFFTVCRIASTVLATAIPSVRLYVQRSVTRRYCVKTTARSTMQFAQSDSKMCLVL